MIRGDSSSVHIDVESGLLPRLFETLLILFVLATFVSPYFTPPSTLGPDGLVRLDQVLLVFIVACVLAFDYPHTRVAITVASTSILTIAGVILVSVVNATFVLGYETHVGDTFDVFLWFSYAAFVLMVSGRVSTRFLKRLIKCLIFGAFLASLVGLLQVFHIWESVPVIQSIYGPGKFETGGRVDGVATNPNRYAQILLIPYFIITSIISVEVYRWLSSLPNHLSNLNLVVLTVFDGILFANIYYSFSRTIIVSLAIGSILIVLFAARELLVSKPRRAIMFVAGVLAMLVGVVIVFPLGRYRTFLNITETYSLLKRLEQWSMALELIRESVWLGHGPGSQRMDEFGLGTADSGLLNWWYHYGVVGVVLFFGILVGVVKESLSAIVSKVNEDSFLYPFLIAVLIHSLVIPVIWQFAEVPRNRRAFTAYIICLFIMMSYVANVRRTESDPR